MTDFFAASLGPRRNAFDWRRLLAGEGPEDAGWTVPEAFFTILFAAVTCDGELATAEHEELLALAHRSRALKSLSLQELSDINVKAVARLREGATSLRGACQALPEELRLPTFAHALDLALADGELTEEEADFLNTLILYLSLPGNDVERIADVIVLKNKV